LGRTNILKFKKILFICHQQGETSEKYWLQVAANHLFLRDQTLKIGKVRLKSYETFPQPLHRLDQNPLTTPHHGHCDQSGPSGRVVRGYPDGPDAMLAVCCSSGNRLRPWLKIRHQYQGLFCPWRWNSIEIEQIAKKTAPFSMAMAMLVRVGLPRLRIITVLSG
jgi:hypothetical protein